MSCGCEIIFLWLETIVQSGIKGIREQSRDNKKKEKNNTN